MTETKLSRRKALAGAGLMVGAAILGQEAKAAKASPDSTGPAAEPAFRFCLNMATIRGQKLGIAKDIEVAGKAGYDGIEPWVDSVHEYVKNGGTFKELSARIRDAGLTVESAIGFAEWIVDDEARRAQGLERAKRDMDAVAQIGGKRFAAPPAGATQLPKLELAAAAERYRVLLEAGEKIGVTPQLELWGFSKNLGRLGECVCVAMETGNSKACVLADVYHLHKGGSDFNGMRLLARNTIQVIHMNDYPSDPPAEKIDDSFRVFPGEGSAPLVEILRALRESGGQKVLSLEIFNRKHWTEDALEVARTGLARMKEVAAKV